MSRALRLGALAMVVLAAVWGLALVGFGGFEIAVFGLKIRSNTPLRPLILGVVAGALYLGAGGRARPADVRTAVVAMRGLLLRRSNACALGLAAITMVVGTAFSTRTAANSDAYGYVSQADLWLKGNLKVAQPWSGDVPWPDSRWSFAPLGYRPAPDAAEFAIVPTYSPGLPILFAFAKTLGGQAALYLVVPLFGGVAVFATYLLGRRLGASDVGLLAAALVAMSPAFLGILMEPLSDVPTMAVWALAFWCLLGPRRRHIVGAGLLVSAAVLIRPNLVIMAGPMAIWVYVRGPATGERRGDLAGAAAFAVAAIPGMAAVAALNAYLYGSPLSSGYGSPGDLFAWSRVATNARNYFGWYVASQSPVALLGMLALVCPLRAVWPTVRDRRIFLLVLVEVASLWLLYMSYLVFNDWGYLRFLLPTWPFLMLGLAAVVLAGVRLLPRDAVIARAAVAVLVVAALAVWQVSFARGAGVFALYKELQHEVWIGALVRDHTGPMSVVMTVERSGSVRYYGGRQTMRYDYVAADQLDRDVAWLTERGLRVYVLLDTREEQEFRSRFAGQQAVSGLGLPLVVYEPRSVSLFALGPEPLPTSTPFFVRVPPAERVGFVEPQALPLLRW